jgi:hypothetical protein
MDARRLLWGLLLLTACPRSAPEPAGSGGAAGATGGAGGDGACPSGTQRCADGCADTQRDPAHCGSCEHDCLGGECEAGACRPVALYPILGTRSAPLVVDETHVYWSSGGEIGQVLRAEKTANFLTEPPEVLASMAPGFAAGVAVHSGKVYWTENGTTCRVMQRSLGGVDDTSVLSAAPDLGQLGGIALDGFDAYYTGFGPTPSSGVVMKKRLGSADPATPILTGLRRPSEILIDNKYLYVFVYPESCSTPSTIVRALLVDGLDPTPIAQTDCQSDALALEGMSLYFFQNGRLRMRANVINDPGSFLDITAPQANPAGIDVHDSGVYWSANGGLYRLAHGAEDPKRLASEAVGRVAVDEDGRAVYWVGSASVMRLAL